MGRAAAAAAPVVAEHLPLELLVRCLTAADSAVVLALAECVSRAWRAAALAAWPRVLAAHGGGDRASYASRRAVRRWLPGAPAVPPAVLRGHAGAVLCCALRFDAAVGRSEFASGGADATARRWRPPQWPVDAWACDGPLRHGAPVTALAFAPGGAAALVTAAGACAYLWRDSACVRRFGAATGACLAALAVADGELFCAAADGSVRCYDLLSGAALRELCPPGGAPAASLAAALPPAPPLLACAGASGLRVTHAASGAPLPWAFEGCDAACAVALRQGDAACAYVGRADGAVVRVCLRTGASLPPARLHHRATVSIHAPSEMPPGCVLVAGGADGLALVTPAATGLGLRAGGARLGLGAVRHLHGAYTGAAAADDAEAEAQPSRCSHAPQRHAALASPHAAAMGALRGAAAGPAWVVSAHADGAVRAWPLPPVADWEQA